MSESALLRAVVTEIRAHNSSATYDARQVEVEIDELAPATAPDVFIMVIPAGIEPGPTHGQSQGLIANSGWTDKLYGVDVAIALRAQAKPRDRQSELLTGFRGTTDLSLGFELHQSNIELQIDGNYAVTTTANALILAESSSTDEFIEPLMFAGAGPIRQAPATLFEGAGDDVSALIRTIRFRGARRIVKR